MFVAIRYAKIVKANAWMDAKFAKIVKEVFYAKIAKAVVKYISKDVEMLKLLIVLPVILNLIVAMRMNLVIHIIVKYVNYHVKAIV